MGGSALPHDDPCISDPVINSDHFPKLYPHSLIKGATGWRWYPRDGLQVYGSQIRSQLSGALRLTGTEFIMIRAVNGASWQNG
jgi:hypothetical protein